MSTTTTLGKRKARDEDRSVSPQSKSHSSTLFVSNLSYDTTSTDLQTAFSDLAPVRSAFVVLEHGTGVSKGVGYVSFSIKQDAQTAFESITANSMTLNGRGLRVQWAENKVVSCRIFTRLPFLTASPAEKQDKGPVETGEREKRKGDSCTKVISAEDQRSSCNSDNCCGWLAVFDQPKNIVEKVPQV